MFGFSQPRVYLYGSLCLRLRNVNQKQFLPGLLLPYHLKCESCVISLAKLSLFQRKVPSLLHFTFTIWKHFRVGGGGGGGVGGG